MKLSNDLISQFVKTTADNDTTKKETTVYGTVVKQGSNIFVKLDGSELLTPASSTTVVKNGERVTVMIKNHTAVITGNISSPAAQDNDVKEVGSKISEFEIIIAGKVSTTEFEAEKARINSVVADNALIKDKLTANDATIGKLETDYLAVNGKLTAVEGDINNLRTKKLDAEIATITYATIANLDATNIKVNNLESTYGDFKDLVTEKLTASEAEITDLKTKKLDVESADLLYAKIGDFTAINGKVEFLEAGILKVNTLLSGNITAGSTDTIVLNARNTTIENALIKSAMVESLAFDKITGIDINTTKLTVHSNDGKSKWMDNTIQISDSKRIRVQIGKDASGDYNMYVWDTAGNLMFDATGVTASGIQRPIIVDSMVSDNANIAGNKINITSLVKEINNGTEVINSSHILVDGANQSLSVVYNTITGDISTLSTVLSVEQGKISSLITDVSQAKGDVSTLQTNYSSLTQTVNGFDARITSATSTAGNALTKANEVSATVDGYNVRISNAETNASSALSKTNVLEQKVTATSLITTISSGISGGTALTTTKFIMDAAGLHIKNGGFDISNNAGTKVFTADANGNLSITAAINAASGKIGKFTLNDGLMYEGQSTYKGMSGQITEKYYFNISPNSVHKDVGNIERDFVSSWTLPLLKVNTSSENSFELFPDGFLRARQIKMGDGVVEGTLYFGSSQYSNTVTINSGGNIIASGYVLASGNVESNGGYLRSVRLGLATQIGSSNDGFCHYITDAPRHYFNKPVYVAGDIYGGSSYNRRLKYADEAPISHNHSYTTWISSQYSTSGYIGFYSAVAGGSRKGWFGHNGGTDFHWRNETNAANGVFLDAKASGYWTHGRFAPGYDGMALGSSGARWYRMYATKACDTASDIRLKTNIHGYDDRYEKMYMDLKPVLYELKQYIGQTDCGLIAQWVKDSMDKYGISEQEFGVYNYHPEDDTYGLAYEQLTSLNMHMIQKTIKRMDKYDEEISKLKQENEELKAKLNAYIKGELEVRTCLL
jgi:hypothetical protein